MANREAGDTTQMQRGLRGAGEIAREDGGDALALEPLRQPLGLGEAAGRERVVRELDGARGVAERLAVPDQEDQMTRSRRISATSVGA